MTEDKKLQKLILKLKEDPNVPFVLYTDHVEKIACARINWFFLGFFVGGVIGIVLF